MASLRVSKNLHFLGNLRLAFYMIKNVEKSYMQKMKFEYIEKVKEND